MGIKSDRINKIKELTASVSGSSARLITNENFKLLSKAIVDIVDDLDIDTGNSIHITDAVLDGTMTTAQGIDVNGGNLTVNAMGQMFAQGGIYTPLAHISRLRLDPDPTSAAIQAGEIRWSGSDFLGWNGVTWESFTGGNYGPGTDVLTITDVTYLELVDLINTASLSPGNLYRITDYQTVHYIQYTGDPGNPTPYVVGEEINVGPVEPLIVQANGTSTLDTKAMSETYPYDTITYVAVGIVDRDFDSVWQGPTQSKGVIVKRFDNHFRVGRDYDFRAFVYRRWETVPGNGVFTSPFPVGGSAYVDMSPGVDGMQMDTTVGYNQVILSLIGFTADYGTDNFVIEGPALGNNIQAGILQHIDSTTLLFFNNFSLFGMNDIANCFVAANNVNIFIANTLAPGGAVTGNKVTNIASNLATSIKENRCESIDGNAANSIRGNACPDIKNNVTSDIEFNIGQNVTDNNVADGIIGNIVLDVSNNSVAGTLSYNVGATIVGSIVGSGKDIIGNNVHTIENSIVTLGGINRNVGRIITSMHCTEISDCNVHTISQCNLGDMLYLQGNNMYNVTGSAYSLSKVSFSDLSNLILSRDIKNHNFTTVMTGAPTYVYGTPDMEDPSYQTQSTYDRGGDRYVELRYENCIPAFRAITDHIRYYASPVVGPGTTDYYFNIGPAHSSAELQYDSTGTGTWTTVIASLPSLPPGDYAQPGVTNPASGTYHTRLVFTDMLGYTFYFDQADITWP